MLRRCHLISASYGKTKEARKKAASVARKLQTAISAGEHRFIERIGIPRSVARILLITISLATATFVGALTYHEASPPQQVAQQAPGVTATDASPRLGGDVGWRDLWSTPPTATAMVGLIQASTPTPMPTATVPSEDRAVLAARSGEREEPSPTPTRTKPLTFEEQFIAQAAPAAQESQRETGVPASVTIAQAILESDWGRSGLSVKAKNFFGIKARGKEGSAGVVWMNTWEVINGQNVTVNEPFRAYKTMADSFTDHGKFFVENARYAAAMKNAGNAAAFAREIHRAGYATDPAYSNKLIALMGKFNLVQYDQQG